MDTAPLLLPAAHEAQLDLSVQSILAAITLVERALARRVVLVNLPLAADAVDAATAGARGGVVIRLDGPDLTDVVVERRSLAVVR